MKHVSEFSGPLPTINLAHVASLSMDIYEYAKKFGFHIISGSDDLDAYDALNLLLGNDLYFVLCKYSSRPQGTVELLFPSQLPDWQKKMDRILNNVFPNAVLWVNEEYYKTP